MMVEEPMVLSNPLYLSFVYAILYLFFQAYLVIFKGHFNLAPLMRSKIGWLIAPKEFTACHRQ